jgi:hypothetical protein
MSAPLSNYEKAAAAKLSEASKNAYAAAGRPAVMYAPPYGSAPAPSANRNRRNRGKTFLLGPAKFKGMPKTFRMKRRKSRRSTRRNRNRNY